MKNGGSAFPKATTVLPNQHSSSERHRLGYTVEGDGGMSIRDYFAAKAMHAELATAGMQLLAS